MILSKWSSLQSTYKGHAIFCCHLHGLTTLVFIIEVLNCYEGKIIAEVIRVIFHIQCNNRFAPCIEHLIGCVFQHVMKYLKFLEESLNLKYL